MFTPLRIREKIGKSSTLQIEFGDSKLTLPDRGHMNATLYTWSRIDEGKLESGATWPSFEIPDTLGKSKAKYEQLKADHRA